MTIWVDGDSCPRLVSDYLRSFHTLSICWVVNSTSYPLYKEKPNVVLVEEWSVDEYILRTLVLGDLVLTRDILLVQKVLIHPGVYAISFYGKRWSREEVERSANEVFLNTALNKAGLRRQSHLNKYSQLNLNQFKITFEELLG